MFRVCKKSFVNSFRRINLFTDQLYNNQGLVQVYVRLNHLVVSSRAVDFEVVRMAIELKYLLLENGEKWRMQCVLVLN